MRRERKNNKGFSLIELIIVIAIMAVLVGTLAPQYLRYVEKSRLAADKTLEEQFITSLQVLAADPDAKLSETGKTYTITSAADTGEITFSEDLKGTTGDKSKDGNTLYAEFVDMEKEYSYKSKEYTAKERTISLTYDTTNKLWKVSSTK